jgi:hypothetical protein
MAMAGAVTVGTAFAVGGSTGPTSSVRPGGRIGGGPPAVTSDAAATDGAAPPAAADAAAIADAVRTSALTAAVPPEAYEVTRTKLARSDLTWAWTELRPRVADLDRVDGVLHRRNGRWALVQIGSWELGCDVVPPQPSRDLGLTCPTSTGPTVRAGDRVSPRS